jgi:hypothetical protein
MLRGEADRVAPPVPRGIDNMLVPLRARCMFCRVVIAGLIVVGLVPGSITGAGGGAGFSIGDGAGALGILGARHMITDCVLT